MLFSPSTTKTSSVWLRSVGFYYKCAIARVSEPVIWETGVRKRTSLNWSTCNNCLNKYEKATVHVAIMSRRREALCVETVRAAMFEGNVRGSQICYWSKEWPECVEIREKTSVCSIAQKRFVGQIQSRLESSAERGGITTARKWKSILTEMW